MDIDNIDEKVIEAVVILSQFCKQIDTSCKDCPFCYDGRTNLGETWCKLRRVSVEDWEEELL